MKTRSGSYVCLQLTRLSLYLQQEIVKVHCKYFQLLCARRSILYFFPLFQSARWCILLTSKKLYSDDLLFLSDLVIHALIPFFTSHRGTRLTKPKETVPGRQLESPSIPVVISPDFILHIIPNWLDLLVRVSSHAPQPNTISALSPPDTTLKGATAGEQCPTCQPPCACYSSSPWKHQATQ